MAKRKLKVGDIIELDGYVGLIHEIVPDPSDPEDPMHVKLDWIAKIHPEYNFRSSHEDADWYPTKGWRNKFKVIGSVLEK